MPSCFAKSLAFLALISALPELYGFRPLLGLAIVPTGLATAFISSPGLMRLVAGPRGVAGLALALAVRAPGLRPLGLAMVPPMRASRAVCVARWLPAPVRSLPPRAVAPLRPTPTIWPELLRVRRFVPLAAACFGAGRDRVVPVLAKRPRVSLA